MEVMPVNFQAQQAYTGRSKTEQAATGVGVGGAVISAKATQSAVKNGVWAQFGAGASKAANLTKQAADKITLASKNVGKFKKLGAAFRLKKGQFVEDFTKFTSNVKNWKVVGKVLNNPITKKVGVVFSGVMAFFVLIPSVLNMVNVAGDVATDVSNNL